MSMNGLLPLSRLVHVSGNIWLPAGTLARWNWAVAQGVAKYGVRLRITGQGVSAWNTWNGYRPLSAQILYKKQYGMLAAAPGLSSHGGTYRGQQVFALDVDNWAELGWARFVALMRLAGLTTNFVTPREEWHVGDFNDPWVAPTFASGGGGSHINPAPTPTRKRRSMSTLYRNKSTPVTYALAGDSPGTSANWLKTQDVGLAIAWASTHGNSIALDTATWNQYEQRYLGKA